MIYHDVADEHPTANLVRQFLLPHESRLQSIRSLACDSQCASLLEEI